jgi:hypothetical protein
MPAPVKRLSDSLRRDGVFRTILKCARYPFGPILRRRAKKNWAEVLSMNSVEERFMTIYGKHLWENLESASGIGSTLWYTEPLRKELPKLVAQFSIKSIFDGACGDFHWMRHLLPTLDVNYIGGDIVRPIIESLKSKYQTERVSFIHVDLIKGSFPKADLMICRDCLPHLSYADTKSVLENFIASGIPYLLATSHKNDGGFVNQDIKTGYFRMMDIFSSPYSFPQDYLFSIDDWVAPEPERRMYLWDREQVSSALARFGEAQAARAGRAAH